MPCDVRPWRTAQGMTGEPGFARRSPFMSTLLHTLGELHAAFGSPLGGPLAGCMGGSPEVHRQFVGDAMDE